MSGSGAALLFFGGRVDSGGGMHRDDSTVTWNRQAKPCASVPYKRKARHDAEKNGNRFQARFIWLQIHNLCATGMLYVGFGDPMTVMKKQQAGVRRLSGIAPGACLDPVALGIQRTPEPGEKQTCQ